MSQKFELPVPTDGYPGFFPNISRFPQVDAAAEWHRAVAWVHAAMPNWSEEQVSKFMRSCFGAHLAVEAGQTGDVWQIDPETYAYAFLEHSWRFPGELDKDGKKVAGAVAFRLNRGGVMRTDIKQFAERYLVKNRNSADPDVREVVRLVDTVIHSANQ